MTWNVILDDMSPALPLLGYQYLSRFHAVTFPSRAANLYFFSGLAAGGAALDLSINVGTPFASLANLVYWGAFTLGLTAFAEKRTDENVPLEDGSAKTKSFEQHSDGKIRRTQPVVNVRYVSQ